MSAALDICIEASARVDTYPELYHVNSGGCGWYAYYLKRAILKADPNAKVEFVMLSRDYYDVDDYKENILHNANRKGKGEEPKYASCVHVCVKVTTPEGAEFYADSEAVYDDIEDVIEWHHFGHDCYVDEVDISPALYRKGALDGDLASQWNNLYPKKKGNKSIREIMNSLVN